MVKKKNKKKIILYSIIGVLVIIAIVIIIFIVNNNSHKSKGKKEIEEKKSSENKDKVVSTGNVSCANNQYYDYNTKQCESKITAGATCKNGVSCESRVCVLGDKYNTITSGSKSVPGSYEYIDETECQEAAQALNKTWGGNVNSSKTVSGCHLRKRPGSRFHNKVYFNKTDNDENCESNYQCIIKKEIEGKCGGNGLSKNCIEIDTTDTTYNKCKTCYNLTLNDQKQCCPTNCLDCDRDGNCKDGQCKSGYYLDNNECKTGKSRLQLKSDITAKNNTITEAKNECNNRSTPHVYSENPFQCLPCTNSPAYIQENVCKNYSDDNTCDTNKWPLWDSSTNTMKCYSEVPTGRFSFLQKEALNKAIAFCVSKNTYVHPTYGPVKYWKFSPQITDLSGVFDPEYYCDGVYDGGCYYVTWTTGASSTRNYRAIQNKVKAWMQKADISGWDVSNVTKMEGMFKNLGSLNNSDLRTKVINIGNRNYMAWDVSNVTNMKYMFNTWTPDKTKIDNWDVLRALNTFSEAYTIGGKGSYRGRGTYSMFPIKATVPNEKLVSNIPGKAPYTAWTGYMNLSEVVKSPENPTVIQKLS